VRVVEGPACEAERREKAEEDGEEFSDKPVGVQDNERFAERHEDEVECEHAGGCPGDGEPGKEERRQDSPKDDPSEVEFERHFAQERRAGGEGPPVGELVETLEG
jgi:hypothetical protein